VATADPDPFPDGRVCLRIFTIFHPGVFTIIHPPLGFAS
jgi:hypothetical protein